VRLRAQLAQCEAENAQLRESAQRDKGDAADLLESERARLESELQRVRQERDAVQAKLTALQATHAKCEGALQALRDEKAAMTSELELTKKTLAERDATIQDLQRTLDELQAKQSEHAERETELASIAREP